MKEEIIKCDRCGKIVWREADNHPVYSYPFVTVSAGYDLPVFGEAEAGVHYYCLDCWTIAERALKAEGKSGPGGEK